MAPGDTIAGRYLIGTLIATGGMASVWQATDAVLQREVAVKILHPHLADDDSFVARFRTEAVAAARLRHANLVSIFDTCSDDGTEAIVMELVRGRNLRSYLDEHGPLHPAEAVHIVSEVAAALAAAHRSGLIHRDIKPANVLIRDDGQVLVTDFGIAKLRDTATDHTQTGMVVGSVRYLAPEQVEGGPVDARSDVYSLGIVLYEALTGRAPFDGPNDAAIALARLREQPLTPRQVRPGIPRALEAVVLKAMARNPDQRFSSAVELRAALLAAPTTDDGTLAEPTGVVAVPAAPRPAPAPRPAQPTPTFAQTERRWLIPTLFIVLVGLAFAVAGILIGRTDAGQELIDRVRGDGEEAQSPEVTSPPGLAVTGARDHDPSGDGSEHPELAALAIDGDPATAWSTEEYSQGLAGVPKPGVGLVIELSDTARVEQVLVESPDAGWSAEVYVADDVPAGIEGWGSDAGLHRARRGRHQHRGPGRPRRTLRPGLAHRPRSGGPLAGLDRRGDGPGPGLSEALPSRTLPSSRIETTKAGSSPRRRQATPGRSTHSCDATTTRCTRSAAGSRATRPTPWTPPRRPSSPSPAASATSTAAPRSGPGPTAWPRTPASTSSDGANDGPTPGSPTSRPPARGVPRGSTTR